MAWGLVQTALLVGLVFAVYAAMAGLRGVRGLAAAIAGIPLSERLIYLIAGAKVAFVEERLFRGDLLGKLSQRTSVVVGVVLSSILFALLHRSLAPAPLGMKFVLGVIFAVFTLRTRSLIRLWGIGCCGSSSGTTEPAAPPHRQERALALGVLHRASLKVAGGTFHATAQQSGPMSRHWTLGSTSRHRGGAPARAGEDGDVRGIGRASGRTYPQDRGVSGLGVSACRRAWMIR